MTENFTIPDDFRDLVGKLVEQTRGTLKGGVQWVGLIVSVEKDSYHDLLLLRGINSDGMFTLYLDYEKSAMDALLEVSLKVM